MSTFLFASIPVPAHTMNPMPFAARLVERGHRVLWYAGEAFHERLSTTGAEPRPYVEAHDFGGGDIFDHFPELAGRAGPRLIADAFADVFVGHAGARVRDLRRILAAQHVDAMLCDELMVGVGLTSELDGPPWATFGDGPLPYADPDTPPFGPGLVPMSGPLGRLRNRVIGTAARQLLFRRANQVYGRTRRELGLAPDNRHVLDAMASPYLHLQCCTPSFEYPRRALPSTVHWVGALRPDSPGDWAPPSWWPEVACEQRPVIHLTQGTLRADLSELVIPALHALSDRDELVVVTTGGPDADDVARVFGRPLPPNVRVAPFVPYDEILSHASLMITNGGYTGVTMALAHGVPIVQAGTTEEKAEIAARIEWSGAGVRLGKTHPRPSTLAAAIERVRTEPSFGAAAARIQAEMAKHDAGSEGADLLEALAARSAPVATSARGGRPRPG